MNQYYKKLDNLRYQCPVCKKIHAGPFPRQDAKQCCSFAKPYSPEPPILQQADQILKDNQNQRPPQPRQNYDNLTQPDPHGHWYRGERINEKKILADYHKAFARIDRELQEKALYNLDALLNEAHANVMVKGKRRSAMQRMAWAYLNHDWESLKRAAVAIANQYADDYLRHWLKSKYEEISRTLDNINMEDILNHDIEDTGDLP